MRSIFLFFWCFLVSGCFYLPLVDYSLLSDYSPEDYSTTKKLYESDSVDIEISAIAHFPNKPRSKNRKVFLVGCKFKVKKNLYHDTLKIDINEAIASAVFSNQILRGEDPKVDLGDADSQAERQLYIIEGQIFFREGLYKTEGGVLYEFQYPKELKNSLREHKLRLDFKQLGVGNRYMELSPIALEFKAE